MRIAVPLALVVLSSTFSGGCRTQDEDIRVASASLVAVGSCDEAIGYVRAIALGEMNKRIDSAIADFENNGCGYYYGGYGEGDYANGGTVGAPSPGASPPTGSGGGSRSSPSNTSGTNNQVKGVDEADFVKNDGHYIYLAQNGVLRIVEAWPAESTKQISVTKLDGTPKKLFVEGDRALVYLSVAKTNQSGNGYYYGSGECTYGYDCDFSGDGQATRLVVFDVSDRAQPKVLRTVDLSGSLIAARRINGAVHTVVSDSLQPFPELQYYPQGNLCDYQWLPGISKPPIWATQKAREAYEKLRAANRKIILEKPLTEILPSAKDSLNGAGLDASALCTGLYRSPLLDGGSFTTLVSLDMTKDEPFTSASVLSRPGAVYASGDALYMAVRQDSGYCSGWYDGYDKKEELSSIHKFRISDSTTTTQYVGSGLVKGHALNQFAMDEKDGYLRIATTSGWVPSPDVSSQVTVLGEAGAALATVGFVGGLGPKEDIRSVRFDGDRGFIVTFKKTDPLFVLDLAQPTSPKVLGELKIPGFSTYMHLLDATHLISIGYDADDHDSFAYFDGVMIQIFDISDPTKPALQHKHVIGSRGSSSESLTNHLAFTYFEPLKILALPMTICEGGDDGQYGDNLTFSGLMLFDIDLQKGITERGRVEHPKPSLSTSGGYNYSCYNWWTQAHSEVKRSIFFDEYVYSISDADLKVQNVDALGADLVSLPLQ